MCVGIVIGFCGSFEGFIYVNYIFFFFEKLVFLNVLVLL